MDKEKVKISDTLMKFFESKGVDKKELEEMAEASDKPAKRKLHPTHKIENLKDMLNISAEKYKDEPAFKFKTDEPGKFDVITYAEFADQVNALGTKLIDMGLQGKKIAVIGENRYEWALAYMAVVCGTGIVVPIDKSLPDNEIEGLMIRSGAEAIFYTNTYDKVMNDVKKRQVSDIRYFISMDIKTRKDGINSQKELVEKGKKLLEDGNTKFLDSTINNEEMGFLLFTSGTTSNSKGVMLSHKNICTNVMDTASVLKVTPGDVILSFLPLHHTFECTAGF
ncbi:MAG: AMP-binding protein, partial [Oscillospiraceae bacterium]|nr:AMP-binding protein [Oscillospiraceae bacterium]